MDPILRAESGTIDYDGFMRIVQEIALSAAYRPSKKIIFDFREALLTFDSMKELLGIAVEMAKYRAALTIKIAHVTGQYSAQIEIARNLENTLVLKVFSYKCFSNFDDAKEWASK